ncbi:DUF4097 family beta strand repeat-containing protein [Viridibacillus arvi]|uniref:DUF4097 domain-containing protein n=1 Tax=Viridibacillus arvi TaxID=263475 RepID=A0A0M0LDJ5_9BACL|nr:DUF4097 family beta strand repeat-containing protein [Viridibacillus arvi]KOO49119.1 hypothetical protein AMD00_12045 [Viridibacillus arvi]
MINATKKLAMSVLIILSVILAGCSSEPITYEEKNYATSAAEVDTITIDVKDRKIEFFQSEDEKIHISYNESEKEFYKIDLSDGKELSMVYASHKDWDDYIGGKAAQENRTIQVWIPDASIENLILKTSNEEIELPPLSFAGAVNIKINNGNIQLDKLNAGTTVTLETKNGDISGSIVGSYDDFAILSEAKKGKSNLPPNKSRGDKTLNVSTNNGNINLEFVD